MRTYTIASLTVLTLLSAALAGGGSPAAAGPGQPAPNFVLHTVDGQTVRLSDLRGKVVIVLFGDVHCAACRANDQLLRLYQYEYVDRGLAVLSLHEHVTTEELLRYDAQFHFIVHTGRDPGNAIAHEYQATLPTTVFIDRNGSVRRVVRGHLNERELVRNLQALL